MLSPSISVGDDGHEIVYVRHLGTLLGRCGPAFVIVLLVVELLGTEDPVDLIRNGSVWVVPEV